MFDAEAARAKRRSASEEEEGPATTASPPAVSAKSSSAVGARHAQRGAGARRGGCGVAAVDFATPSTMWSVAMVALSLILLTVSLCQWQRIGALQRRIDQIMLSGILATNGR